MNKAKINFPVYINREFCEFKEGEDVSAKVKCPVLLQQLIDSGRVDGKVSSHETKVEPEPEKKESAPAEDLEESVEEVKVVEVEETKVEPKPANKRRKPAKK
jgi:TPP-dependent indolepyruvate ferredoxin oxidoreductase alpha subunit